MNYELKKNRIGVLALFLIVLMVLFAGCATPKVSKQTDQEVEKLFEPKLITGISVSEDSESINVLVAANSLLTYTSVKQPVPLSVVLYFPETALSNVSDITPDSDFLGLIQASDLAEKHTVRVEISLKKDLSYEVTREDTGLKISFVKASEILASTEPQDISNKPDIEPAEEDMPTATELYSVDAEPFENSVEITVRADGAIKDYNSFTIDNPAWVNRIDFSSEDAGKSTIIIGTTRPVKYDLEKAADNKLDLKLYNTRLPDYRQRPLITTRFESAVDRIIPLEAPADTSLIAIELRESVPYFVEQTDNLLLLHFEASSVPPKPYEQTDLPYWQKVLSQTSEDKMTEVTTAVEAEDISVAEKAIEPAVTETKEEVQEKDSDKIYQSGTTQKYTGDKITLDFYKTDIKEVFRLLREFSGENFAIDKDVTGEVTLSIDKPAPWDQVLDLILKMNQLGQTSEGNIIRIATLETLKKQEESKSAEIIAAQKARKEQEAVEPLVTAYIPVNYAKAIENILPHLEKIISKDRGSAAAGEDNKSPDTDFGKASVSADGRTNTIIMTDTAEKIKQAREIIKQLDKVTPQVMIEARIVEATDTFSREIGVNWNVGTDATGSAQINSNALGGDYGYNAAVNLPITSAAGAIGFNFSRLIGSPFLLNATLQASESKGEVKIISSPKILTLHKETATIEQGLEYPQTTRDEAGNVIPGDPKKLTLKLEVTPQVTPPPDNRILMDILIQNDGLGSLAPDGTQIFTRKSATTKLLVNNGETIVIGGIRKTTKNAGEQGIPWLSKIPVLGWLFKSQSKIDDKEELLIFITPQIVQLEQQSNNTDYK